MIVVFAVVARSAAAQTPTLLPRLVFDIRAASVSLPQDPVTASNLALDPAALRKRALAVVGGAHLYLYRRPGFAVGVGEEVLLGSRGHHAVVDNNGLTGDLTRRVQGFSTIVSANFGGRNGWSHLSGGVGPVRFETITTAVPQTRTPFRLTPNFGGGARWFTTEHMAVGFDVRAYFTPAVSATATTAGKSKSRLLVIAVGLTIR